MLKVKVSVTLNGKYRGDGVQHRPDLLDAVAASLNRRRLSRAKLTSRYNNENKTGETQLPGVNTMDDVNFLYIMPYFSNILSRPPPDVCCAFFPPVKAFSWQPCSGPIASCHRRITLSVPRGKSAPWTINPQLMPERTSWQVHVNVPASADWILRDYHRLLFAFISVAVCAARLQYPGCCYCNRYPSSQSNAIQSAAVW